MCYLWWKVLRKIWIWGAHFFSSWKQKSLCKGGTTQGPSGSVHRQDLQKPDRLQHRSPSVRQFQDRGHWSSRLGRHPSPHLLEPHRDVSGRVGIMNANATALVFHYFMYTKTSKALFKTAWRILVKSFVTIILKFNRFRNYVAFKKMLSGKGRRVASSMNDLFFIYSSLPNKRWVWNSSIGWTFFKESIIIGVGIKA